MSEHPTPSPAEEADDLIQRTIERELARTRAPAPRDALPLDGDDPPARDGPEPPGRAAPVPRRAIYLLPCLTAVFAAAFCVLLGVYLFQLHQDDARYAQLGETLTAVLALSEENDSLREQIDDLEAQIDTAQEKEQGLSDLLSEATTEAGVLSALYRAELYLHNGDYHNAALMLTTRTVTDMTAYLEGYDAYNAGYYGQGYVPLLPRYQDALDTLVDEGYLVVEVQGDGTEVAGLSDEVIAGLTSSTYPQDGPTGEGG